MGRWSYSKWKKWLGSVRTGVSLGPRICREKMDSWAWETGVRGLIRRAHWQRKIGQYSPYCLMATQICIFSLDLYPERSLESTLSPFKSAPLPGSPVSEKGIMIHSVAYAKDLEIFLDLFLSSSLLLVGSMSTRHPVLSLLSISTSTTPFATQAQAAISSLFPTAVSIQWSPWF